MFEERKASKKLIKLLTMIREETEHLKRTIIEVRKEREQLEYIKSLMEEDSPKINISNVYVFKNNNIKYIVKYEIRKDGRTVNLKEVNPNNFYYSRLIDIFSNQIIYEEFDKGILKEDFYIKKYNQYNSKDNDYIAKLIPILEVEPNLLVYSDRNVPIYILERLNYKINNIDVKAPILQKLPKN